jgi:hypothetical protein
MSGFNPAWWIAIGIGLLLVAADFLMPEVWRRKLGHLCAILGATALLIGIGGIAWPHRSVKTFNVEACAPIEDNSFVLVDKYKHGIDIEPIDLLISLDVTNLRSTRTSVESYEL